MSKKAIVCTILALSLILVGTGYAYWTDTLNVTTKATTGDMDVTFADLGLYAQYGNEYNGDNWSIIDGIGVDGYIPANYFERGADNYNIIAKDSTIADYYADAQGYNDVQFDAKLVDPATITKSIGPYAAGVVNGSDNIVITVENIYPGYAQAFRTDILNQGSIAAKLSNLNFKVSGVDGVDVNAATRHMLGVAILVEREYFTDTYDEGSNVFELCKALGLADEDIFTIGGVEFARLSALNNIKKEALESSNTILAFPSQSRMDLYLAVAMDPDADGKYTTGSTKVLSNKDDAKTQGTGAQISVNLLWDQFNEGKDVNSTNRLEEQNR